jgi:hypothetical protein
MGMKLTGIIGVLLLAMTASFYWYYKDTQSRMAILNENNARLEIAIQINQEAISELKLQNYLANAELKKINTAFSDSREENRQLVDRLSKHELKFLAASKPALVQGIINNASDKALRCFELISGSPLTEKEKDAINAKSFNSECPWLWASVVP